MTSFQKRKPGSYQVFNSDLGCCTFTLKEVITTNNLGLVVSHFEFTLSSDGLPTVQAQMVDITSVWTIIAQLMALHIIHSDVLNDKQRAAVANYINEVRNAIEGILDNR
jgi:hypothetical protein